MLDELTGYDWEQVFGDCISEDRSWSSRVENPWSVDPAYVVSEEGPTPFSSEPFTRNDVVEIVAQREGERDERDWVVVCKLADGRYALMSGGCDYTGWDCQSNVARFVGPSLPAIQRWAMSKDERREFNMLLPEEQ